MVKSCTVVLLAGNFLFTSSDTFAVGCMYLLATKCNEKIQRNKLAKLLHSLEYTVVQ